MAPPPKPDPKADLKRLEEQDSPIPKRQVAGAALEDLENAGEGIAIIDEFLKKKFPGVMGVGRLGDLWGIWEVIGFLKSGGRENRGDVAALVAEFIAERGRKQIAKGAVLTGASKAGIFFAEAFVVAWTAWEAFKLGAYIRSRLDGEPSEREQMYQKWELHLHQHLWSPMELEMRDLREMAFDQIAGDVASHGVVPALTVEAAKELHRLKNWHARRVLDALHRVRELERSKITFSMGIGPSVTRDFASPKEKAEAARDLELALAYGIKEVIEFQTNHLNWNLTKEQIALLPESHQGYYAIRDSNPGDGPVYGPQPRPR